MKEKIVKTMLIVSLIMAMTLVGVITLGKNLVIIENKSSKEQISHAKATEQSGLVMETTEKLTVELKGISGGEVLKEGQEVYEGQGITYEINLTNDSQETLSNINVKAIHTNAIYYDALPEHFSFAGTEEEITKIKENPELTEKVSNIEKIEPGETKQIKYQISVKEVEEENQTTKGDIQIQIDGTEELQIETPTCKIMSAELKATFHSVYQEEIDIFSEQYYPVEFRVQNISDNNIENVIIEAELPDELDFSIENIYLGNENEGDDEDDEDYDYDPTEEEEYEDEEGEGYQGDNEEIKYELIDYKDKILRLKIPVIGANETVSIEAQLTANEIAYDQVTVDTNLHFKAIVDDKTYTSNDLYRTIHQGKPSIEIEQTANRENNETIEDGDDIIFTFTIKNKGAIDSKLFFNDIVPEGINVQESYLLKEEERTDIESIYNIVNNGIFVKPNETAIVEIYTKVNAEQVKGDTVTNYAEITGRMVSMTTNEITFKVKKPVEEDPDDPYVPVNPDDPNNPENQTYYSLSGEAWNDKNKNARKDKDEPRLSNIPILLVEERSGKLAKDKNGNELITKTKEDGTYQFENVAKGNYQVIFQYDNNKYTVTSYQKEGIKEESNSDVISNTVTLNNKQIQVAMTKTLEVKEANLLNIDAGFIEKGEFDFKLDKYISKVTIQNNKGTTIKQYNKGKLAKIEIDSKLIENSTLFIEYQIEVTNEGEIAGYAKDIVDDKPEDLVFNVQRNKGWYQSTNGELHSSELSNQMIEPGESKILTLILEKRMSSNNTGTIVNEAKISKASNYLSVQDSKRSNNKSTAEIIVSIRTGSILIYFTLIVMIIIAMGSGIYLINKKVLGNDKNEIEEKL